MSTQLLKVTKPGKTFYYTGNYETVAIVRPKGGSQFWVLSRYNSTRDGDVDFPTRTAAEYAVENGYEVLER